MTSQQRADALLAAWQLLRHIPADLRLPVIDMLVEIERVKSASRANRPCLPRYSAGT